MTGQSFKRFMSFSMAILFFLLLLNGCNPVSPEKEKESSAMKNSFVPQKTKNIFLADPTVFLDNGTYYLYGTVDTDPSKGFLVYSSSDLKSWKLDRRAQDGYALKKGDAFGEKDFWAPQVFSSGGTCYMAYVANERIAVAESESGPYGPFRQRIPGPLFQKDSWKNIDPFVFFDDDGKKYLYYVQEQGENRICVTEIDDRFDRVKEGLENEKICIRADLPWENTVNSDWPVAEGPSVLKINGWYYLFYSTNDFRSRDYSVGYAVSKSPLGPWKKQNKPILSRKNVPAFGTGHGDFFRDNDKNLWYVFHTHFNVSGAIPRKTALIRVKIKPEENQPAEISVDPDSFYYLKTVS